jgi:hypothetical protein
MNEEVIETRCPICSEPVKKVHYSNQEEIKKQSTCSNEFYVHINDKLYKIKNPQTRWS